MSLSVQYGFIPYLIVMVLRQLLSVYYTLFIEVLILLINPLFGVFAGLEYIVEVCFYVTFFNIKLLGVCGKPDAGSVVGF